MGRKIQEDLPGEVIIELGGVPGIPLKATEQGPVSQGRGSQDSEPGRRLWRL